MHVCVLSRFSRVPILCHGLYPARLLCPWDSPGDITGVGCHAFLQGFGPGANVQPFHTDSVSE